MIYYAGGKLDFTLLPARELQNRTYARPFRVLLDKDGYAATITRQDRLEFAHPTRYLGTRMRQWMDNDIQAKLPACWAGLGEDAVSKALLETVSLYRMLAERTATALQLPAFDHARVETELADLLSFE